MQVRKSSRLFIVDADGRLLLFLYKTSTKRPSGRPLGASYNLAKATLMQQQGSCMRRPA